MPNLSNLPDRDISFTLTASVICWIVGFILVIWDVFAKSDTDGLGLLLAGVGGVLTIRGYLCALAKREERAFRLGQESVRSIH